jgi:hypothetical protein
VGKIQEIEKMLALHSQRLDGHERLHEHTAKEITLMQAHLVEARTSNAELQKLNNHVSILVNMALEQNEREAAKSWAVKKVKALKWMLGLATTAGASYGMIKGIAKYLGVNP